MGNKDQLRILPLYSHFKVVAGPENDILCVFVPEVEHIRVVDSDNSIASSETCSFSRRSSVYLENPMIFSNF